jgi:hypothetical protein
LLATPTHHASRRTNLRTDAAYFRDTTLLSPHFGGERTGTPGLEIKDIAMMHCVETGIVEIESAWTARNREAQTKDRLAQAFLSSD